MAAGFTFSNTEPKKANLSVSYLSQLEHNERKGSSSCNEKIEECGKN